ncbi:hypothetical protein C0Q70_02991 [Pomacea canaliculata]|uniref:Uncharacterized protein n=1 Tax=Pomacea canaliculata TaxID=400727 RepID=A0A2T7PRG7_POMCA|nr:hypothetical protein C0Q70_02991 [Pomacea canaliculata]
MTSSVFVFTLTGRWVIEYKGQENYNISVQGESPLGLEITLYEIDTITGVSELVQNSPTAGRPTRIILDIVGAELMGMLFNISLVTSDGRSLASDWVRHTGGPNDPQYATTLTWPAESVYVLAVGTESSGDSFQRQSPYTFVPTLIDLQLLNDPGTSVMHSSVPLTIRYTVTNYGQTDTLLLSTSVDNKATNVSPSKIVLGQGSTFTGSVTVTVEESTVASSETGLLQVRVTSRSDPHETQKATRLLTVGGSKADDKPPSCHVISITSNCSASAGPDGRRSKCGEGQWTVRALVSDDVSGLASVSFSGVSASDEYVIEPIIKGQATKEVPVFYRTTCCKKSITLLTSDEAGHANICEFLQDSIGVTTGKVSQGKVSPNTKQSLTMTSSPVQRSSRVSSTTWFGPTLQGETIIVPPRELQGTTYSPLSLNANSHLEGVTREQGAETEDYSTVKVAAVALGSVGGVAGLSVIILCSLYFFRYRRYRRRESRDDEDNLSSSTISTVSQASDFRCSVPSRASRRGL